MGNDFEEIHWNHILALASLLDVDPVKLIETSANQGKLNAYQEKMVTGGLSILGSLIGSLPDKRHKAKKSKKKKTVKK
jgi:hypothetical protein